MRTRFAANVFHDLDQPGSLATGRRSGLTLLEVVVAMAIFLMSLVAIWQLLLLSGDRALDVKLLARTSMVCQSKLAEVMIGAEPPNSTSGYTSLPDEANKDLQWKMEVQSSDVANLYNVKISVKAELPNGRIFESHLTQMVLDPAVRGSTLDPPPVIEPPATPPPMP